MADFKKIAESIAASYDARSRIVKDIAGDTQKLLQTFREQREAMAVGLRDALSKSENLRKKDFNKMMEDILALQTERENNVQQILAEFSREEEGVAVRLRELLSRGEGIRIKDFKKIISRIRKEQEKRQKEVAGKASGALLDMQKEVSNMLGNFKKEREKMANEWREAITSMKAGKN